MPLTIPVKTRFEQKIHSKNGCWIWKAAKDNSGYAMFWLNGKTLHASRVSMLLYKKIEAKEFQVCHTCDNPSCVNPEHLFLGTAKDNAKDREQKLRGDTKKRKGERNPNSKVTNEQANHIRKMFASGWKQKELANRFKMCQSNISRIINNKRYAN